MSHKIRGIIIVAKIIGGNNKMKALEWIARTTGVGIPVVGFSLLFGGADAFADEPKELEIEVVEPAGKNKEKEEGKEKGEDGSEEENQEGPGKEKAGDEEKGEPKASGYHAFSLFGEEIDASEAKNIPKLDELRNQIISAEKSRLEKNPDYSVAAPEGELLFYKFKPGKDEKGRDAVLMEIHYKGADGKEAIYSNMTTPAAWDGIKSWIAAGEKRAKSAEQSLVKRLGIKKDISEHADIEVADSNAYLKFKNLPGFAGNGNHEINARIAADYSLMVTMSEEVLMKMAPEERAAKVKALRKMYDTLAKARIGVREKEGYFLELHYSGKEKPKTIKVSEKAVASFIERISRLGQWEQSRESAYEGEGKALKQKDDHSDPSTEFGKRDKEGVVLEHWYQWSELQKAANDDPDVQYVVGFMDRILNSGWIDEKGSLEVTRGGDFSKKRRVFYFRAGKEDAEHELRAPDAQRFDTGYEKLVSLYKPAGKKGE